MIFRQLFDRDSSTYSYLIADPESRETVIIDPVLEQIERDLTLLRELELTLTFTLDTHVHADHISASGELRKRTGAQSVLSADASVPCVSVPVKHGDRIPIGPHELKVKATPGHTGGCTSYLLEQDDQGMLFTGDTLLIRGCGRTDFQGGDSRQLFRSIQEEIFSLPPSYVIYPGHDYKGRLSSTVAEERLHNPRINANTDEEQFVETMAKLELENPALMTLALPANMACGQIELPDEASGVTELSPEDIEDITRYLVIDVRQPEEFDGPLGHIKSAALVPLETIDAAAQRWPPEQSILIVCRSGRRSRSACRQLQELGFSRVANLTGGMIAWNAKVKK